MINDVNNLLLRERGAVTMARPQQFYVCTREPEAEHGYNFIIILRHFKNLSIN